MNRLTALLSAIALSVGAIAPLPVQASDMNPHRGSGRFLSGPNCQELCPVLAPVPQLVVGL